MPGRALDSQKVEFVEDIRTVSSHAFYRKPMALEVGLRSAAAFPIVVRNKTVMVIELFSKQQLRNPVHLSFVESVGLTSSLEV